MSLQTIATFLLLLTVTCAENTPKTYRAASVQYQPFYKPHTKPEDLLVENAKRYAEYAKQAAKQKAIIVAFPEYGLVTLEDEDNINYTRDAMLPYFQTVPDPLKISWNPCLEPSKYNETAAIHVLSCLARDNSIAILANVLSKEECNNEIDPNCPKDGRYLCNTNIVFDKTGRLIARYHKHHLFGEDILDAPKTPEYVTFTIDGIRFATFICFDMIYADPAVDFVKIKGIKNFIHSTAWPNEMPFISATQLFSRWARGLGVNLIVTNYYTPEYERFGTGIYSSQLGALNETNDISIKGHLLVADLPLSPQPVPVKKEWIPPIKSDNLVSMNAANGTYFDYIITDKPSSKPVQPINKINYQSLINFTAIHLKNSHGNVSKCHKAACCNLVYNISTNGDTGIYALLVYDGLHFFSKYRFGMQTCAVMRCENVNDKESCGRVPKTTPMAKFDQLELTSQLDAEDVFPSIVQDDLQLLPAADWSYSTKTLDKKSQSKIELNNAGKSILIASLYGRMYDRDYEVSFD